MNNDFIVKERPSLLNPLIVCGLPGSAFVGKFALDHLVQELGAKPLAEVYSEGFPPEVIISQDGIATLMKNDIYYWRHSSRGTRDLLLYTGDAQPSTPEEEYNLSEKVVDFMVRQHGAKELATLGAYVTGSETVSPRVYCAAIDQSMSEKMKAIGCTMMNEGAITGMNGLLLGIARLKGLSGYTLLGETSGLVFEAKASRAILEVLSRMTGINLSYSKLDERAKKAQEAMMRLEEMREGRGGRIPKRKLDYIS